MSARIAALAVALMASAPVLASDQPRASVRVIFTGDIMLDDGPGKAVERDIDPFEPFRDVFAEADLVIGNLECVVATTGVEYRKPYTFRAHPRVIPLLVKHFDAVSIANNHTGDFGDEAFAEQLELLSSRVPTFGGGRNRFEARQPLIIEKNDLRIALLGYNEFKPRAFEAGENDPGVAWGIDERILEDLRIARETHRAKIILPFLHWGHEYEPHPDDSQRVRARAMIDAGATAVVGAHPHVTQDVEIHEGRPIFYSLGNFVFDGFDRPEAKVAWLLRLTIDAEGVAEWDTVVARMDAEGLPTPDFTTPSPSGRRGSAEILTRVATKPSTKSPNPAAPR
jgi:poly-gamma-glutamate capsule biosynthesis protein CapA/YwtB (metallophosphatase superfamily)